jgi:hypothetical protein
MKGFTNTNTKDIRGGGYAKPPFKPGQMVEMPRTVDMGMYGDSKKLTVNAKYGVDGYDGPDKIVSMPRETSASAGGSGASSLTTSRAMYGVEGQADMNYGMQCYGTSGVKGAGDGKGGKRSSLRSAGGTR